MQHQFVITIGDNVSSDFVVNFLKNISFIKAVKPKNSKKKNKIEIDDVTLLSQNSLSEEWLSDDDNRWDKLL